MRFTRSVLTAYLILSFNFLAKAQKDIEQGEGIITVSIVNQAKADSTNGGVFKTYRYFIKGNKILRKDSIAPSIQMIRQNEKTTPLGNFSVKSNFAASWVHPTYLIDLEKQQAFTFFEKNSQLFVSVDTLDKHFEEVFYKPKNKSKEVTYRLLPSIQPKIVAGKKCLTGLRMSKRDTAFFQYTTEPMEVKSPLNVFIPDFPYNILSVNSTFIKKTGESDADMIFIVTEIQEISLDQNMFLIPVDAVIRKEVPLSEMVYGLGFFQNGN